MIDAPSYWGWEDDVRTEEVREDGDDDGSTSSSGSSEDSPDPDGA
jgi:hypothetical protein